MISKFSGIRTFAAASAMSMALVLSPVSVFAATGTANASNINVRSAGTTTSSVVGTVNTGDVFDIGESTTDESGATWYQVTLSNGTIGYIRSDFITINNDDADTSEEEVTEETDDGTSTDTSDESSDPAVTAATEAASQDTGGYQVVLAPDQETGEQTYYLYDNNQGVRMKISDIQALPDQLAAAQEEAASVRTRYRVILIGLAAACAALAVGCIVLALRLRDALANGRRERDLTMERRDQRRNNRNADSVESLRRSGRTPQPPARTAAGRGHEDAYVSGASRRDEPYASGTRRVPRDTEGSARDVRNVRTSTTSPVRSERRPAVRDSREGYPSNYAGRSQDNGVRESSRPVRTARNVRDEEDDRDVRPVSRPVTERSDRTGTVSNAPARTARPAGDAGERSAGRTSQTAAPRTTARKSSGRDYSDEDFDYDFLQLNDKDEQ